MNASGNAGTPPAHCFARATLKFGGDDQQAGFTLKMPRGAGAALGPELSRDRAAMVLQSDPAAHGKLGRMLVAFLTTDPLKQPFEGVLPYLADASWIKDRMNGQECAYKAIMDRLADEFRGASEHGAAAVLRPAVDAYCASVLSGDAQFLHGGRVIAGPDALTVTERIPLGQEERVRKFLVEHAGFDPAMASTVAAAAAQIDLRERLQAVARMQRIATPDAAEVQQTTSALPLTREQRIIGEVVKLVRDATRVEMWTTEALTAQGGESMREFTATQQRGLEQRVNALSAALDREPPEIAEIRQALAAMEAPLRDILDTVRIGNDRLATGLAASVTWAQRQSGRGTSR